LERRLAAILAADVVGYSRLMGKDEAGTLSALNALRTELIDPKIAEHKGRIFKATGDGLMAEFPSVVNAVACAADIQRAMAGRNADLPEDETIALRIGINVGDVIVEGGDVFGDGVNVAARLEGVAPSGGISLSGAARDHIGNRLELQFEDMGELALKNIDPAVRVFCVHLGERGAKARSALSLPDKPSIAVLPFQNMSGDPAQQFFSDGMTEDIITELARFRQMHVLARNSSFRFRGSDLDMMRVGRELGVQYLVEGSVRLMGNRIRISAQLIDAADGKHVWADRYDRSREEIFAVQDQLVQTIVATLVGRMHAAGSHIARRKAPASLAAYEYVLRADSLAFDDSAARVEARHFYAKAIALDPNYARAYALLALCHSLDWEADLATPDSLLDQAVDLARKSVDLDENDGLCHDILGQIYVNRRLFDLAERHFQRALALNPNRSTLMGSFGWACGYLGKPEQGNTYLENARLIDPYFEPSWYWRVRGVVHFTARQYEEAVAALGRSTGRRSIRTLVFLAASLAQLGRDAEAQECKREVLHVAPDFSIEAYMARQPFRRDADRQHLVDALRKAGLPE
jgi:adenylate cyclase